MPLSILFPEDDCTAQSETDPRVLSDLNLDRVLEAIIAPTQADHLMRYFLRPLGRAEAVRYRQDVMRELENEALIQLFRAHVENARGAAFLGRRRRPGRCIP